MIRGSPTIDDQGVALYREPVMTCLVANLSASKGTTHPPDGCWLREIPSFGGHCRCLQ